VITAVPGVRVGHWTGERTGVTAVLAPAGTIGSGEVRGGAPASRETALLEPARLVERVDAVVLAGGSAFGLAAADGAMRFLAERGQGFPTAGGPVPIVVGACIFDLVAGGERPGAEEGYLACVDAERGDPGPPGSGAGGRIGAGRGATVGKWRGPGHGVAGGLGTAAVTDGDLVVWALAVVNAAGDVVAADGRVLAGSTAPADVGPFGRPLLADAAAAPTNTTLLVCATNAVLARDGCYLLAQSAHHGLAGAVRPSHTRFDGDLAVSLATGDGPTVPVDLVRLLAVDAVAAAVRAAVGGP
jgi:L-aminopeptidase/D-esterase-like protein